MKDKRQTISEQILGSLLKSAKTTAQLAIELGYVNPQGTPRYNVINRDLKNLVTAGYITGKKKKTNKVGNFSTLYSIVFGISNLKKMLDQYPNLLPQMQKNNSMLNTISHEFLYTTTNLKTARERLAHMYLIYSPYGVLDPKLLEILKQCGESLKKNLQLSPKFFQLLLEKNKEELINYSLKLASVWEDPLYPKYIALYERYKSDTAFKVSFLNLLMNLLFKACVSTDITNGKSNAVALEHVNQINKQIKDGLQEQQLTYIEKYYERIFFIC